VQLTLKPGVNSKGKKWKQGEYLRNASYGDSGRMAVVVTAIPMIVILHEKYGYQSIYYPTHHNSEKITEAVQA